jgi:hypothetical protein
MIWITSNSLELYLVLPEPVSHSVFEFKSYVVCGDVFLYYLKLVVLSVLNDLNHTLCLCFWNLKVLLYVGMYLYIIWNESCCQFWMIWTKRSVSWMYVCMGRGSRPRRRFRVPLWLITLGAFESCKQFSSLVRNFWVLYNDVIVDVRTCMYFTYQFFLSQKFGQFLSSTP